ncbi:MAG TPA: TIGR03087 family PEP-CTERM/XrtA system glycosyltransferase [Rhodanobacter sp.]|jgi:sugar transferase (PEP-CTERM/EpsH1 system associated)|nr:TIGR03087 family PEP-CTERM/XrtA system glycosyltransferase [Rhodanobacter sp.]
MDAILFLCHRLPWPPDKGDKIRSYHVLRRLAERYRVYLGTFVDEPADWQYIPAVEAVCAGTCIRPLKPWRARWRALTGLPRGEALTLGYYRDRTLQRWVDEVISEHHPELALCYSSGVAPFVKHKSELRRVMDFVDADSDKWRQYARSHNGLARTIYAREARKLAAFERAVATQFDASLFVSEAEAKFFREQVPAAAGKVHGIANGVDGGYWNPHLVYANPYSTDTRAVVFTGAMDYRANVDAVEWFAREVWPRVFAQRQDARFYIVGSNPAATVRALAQHAGIMVTGRVEDVRPYLAHARIVAAPLRIARGIQNKVLEALAMEKVVLATPEAWEGIADFDGREGCISDSPEAMANEALRWLALPQPARVPDARAMVRSLHDWARNLDTYESLLREPPGIAAAPSAVAAEACA